MWCGGLATQRLLLPLSSQRQRGRVDADERDHANTGALRLQARTRPAEA